MTITIQDIPDLLVEPSKINYLKELTYLNNQSINKEDDNDDKLLNTLELFTFGNFKQYNKYKTKYIELNEIMINKLIKLTLISINTDFINQIISFDKINQIYDLNIGKIYNILIELNFQNLINIQIDDVQNVLIIKEKKILRDVYNDDEDDYKLRVLNEDEDLGVTKLVKLSKLKLQNWINEKLNPVKNEIENRLNTSLIKDEGLVISGSPPINPIQDSIRFENTRKRKTPDNI
ncbi:MAG: hypothetical protein M5E90_08450 [Asgard group archaeon]|nr:hypothetical protein [Asgard group archaeon]